MFEPNPQRALATDQAVRARLGASLYYLDEFLGKGGALAEAQRRVDNGAVSPFVFCLYSQLVAQLSTGAADAARMTAGEIAAAAGQDADSAILPYQAPGVPDAWWSAYHALLDTEPGRDFRPVPPTEGGLDAFRDQYAGAMETMARCDPDLAQEVVTLIRLAVPAAPRDASSDQRFNGASTFLAWGAAIFNSEVERRPVEMIDVLVHESGHLLLFGLVEGGALTQNAPSERYTSPLRQDPRPIDGVFHACFVATRVHLAMNRLSASGGLDRRASELARLHAERNGASAVQGLEVLNRHARTTEIGGSVLAELNRFWSDR